MFNEKQKASPVVVTLVCTDFPDGTMKLSFLSSPLLSQNTPSHAREQNVLHTSALSSRMLKNKPYKNSTGNNLKQGSMNQYLMH